MNIIGVHSGMLGERPKYYADVVCTDPYWNGEVRRIEVHFDVARYINQLHTEKAKLKQTIRELEQTNG